MTESQVDKSALEEVIVAEDDLTKTEYRAKRPRQEFLRENIISTVEKACNRLNDIDAGIPLDTDQIGSKRRKEDIDAEEQGLHKDLEELKEKHEHDAEEVNDKCDKNEKDASSSGDESDSVAEENDPERLKELLRQIIQERDDAQQQIKSTKRILYMERRDFEYTHFLADMEKKLTFIAMERQLNEAREHLELLKSENSELKAELDQLKQRNTELSEE